MKDILAAITFVATGLLMLVAQTGKAPDGSLFLEVDCKAVETVVVQDHSPEVPEHLELNPQVNRDS